MFILHEGVNRELRILSLMFGAMLLIGIVLYVIWIMPTPSPKISPLEKSLIVFPSAQSIQTVTLAAGGCENGLYAPKNSPAVAEKALKWLKEAEPLSVKLPKLHEKLASGCGLPFSSLYLQMKNGGGFGIFPANYIWRGSSISGHETFETRYVEDVIEVEFNQKIYFFRSQSFYGWLQSGGWTRDFPLRD